MTLVIILGKLFDKNEIVNIEDEEEVRDDFEETTEEMS